MSITPEEVAKLAAVATPGPWEVSLQETWWVFSDAGEVAEVMPWNGETDGATAAFIAAAHDMADLVERQAREIAELTADRIEELEAKLAKAVEALDKIKRIDNLVGVFAACERTLAELTGGNDDR